MKYKLRFAAFFTAMIVFNLAANFAHPGHTDGNSGAAAPRLHVWSGVSSYADHKLPVISVLGKINNYISSRLSLLICCLGYGVAQVWFA